MKSNLMASDLTSSMRVFVPRSAQLDPITGNQTVQLQTMTLADSMIVIARYVSVSNSRNAALTGVHFLKVVPEAGQTKRAMRA